MAVLLHDLLQQITVFVSTLHNDKRTLEKRYERRVHAIEIIPYNRMEFNIGSKN